MSTNSINTMIDSIVESKKRSMLSKGIDLGKNWMEMEKIMWKNALDCGQCTEDDLQKVLFNK